ncbi:transporter substrate-binding domain-containing protein [Glycomyces sp. NRRL B-16210]|uniref:transporter substrate-binding domain-containing protein n=1 Tax=Glycomyces sp. NRRL B-16210 TaxID=1463821 RepID=UPI0004C0E6BB|nr:transporter substrate-binding domain-containing protein [Glycomyces sp. NRRL B-16210]
MSKELHLNRRTIFQGTAAGAAAMALAACSRTDSGGDDGNGGGTSLLQKAQDGGKIRVAYANEPPYAYTEGDNVLGQSVDVQTHLLGELGIGPDQIEWKLTDWGALITGLGTNHDMVIAGMYVTPDRCAAVAFADPDYIMPDALLVTAGNPGGWTTLNAMADTDGVIGVMNGTSEQEVADQIFDEDRINVQANLAALILELKAGRCDAVGLTSANLKLAADADGDVETTDGFWLTDPETGEDIIGAGAAVFQPKDTDFRDAINEKLQELLADTETWEGLVSEYGFTVEENHPEGLTAQDLCPDTYQ